MLDPNDRLTLVESLRPPDGYELSYAVGTTFTLDLIAALTCPLSFAMFDFEDAEGRLKVDPLALLESLRRYASKMSIFCQAGQIAMPPAGQALLPYLESSIIESNAPTPGHIFHPKVWVLRFTDASVEVLYRVVCVSRNLTFDRCWDSAVVLEGTHRGRAKPVAASHPLADFVAALPGLARDPVISASARKEIRRIEHEVRRTKFDPPTGFDEVSFMPLGLSPGRSWPLETRIDRLLVVSPFIEQGALERLAGERIDSILVSRLESLAAVKLDGFADAFVLNDAADVETQDEPHPSDEDVDVEPDGSLLRGLHAKIYVADAGWHATMWIGSANATMAAFEGNVEFLVQLNGPKSKCGISAILDEENPVGFRQLLQRFEPDGRLEIDEVAEALQRRAEDVRYRIAQQKLLARIAEDAPDSYSVRIEAPAHNFRGSSDATIRCWPARLAAGAAVTVSDGPLLASFARIPIVALTSFFVFEVTVREAGRQLAVRFALNVPLDGAPSDRLDRILAETLKDKDQVLRYLLFLLGDATSDSEGSQLVEQLLGGVDLATAEFSELPLLEAMMRSLARDPERLDGVADLLQSLGRTPDGQQRIPDGFLDIWEPVWAARKSTARG